MLRVAIVFSILLVIAAWTQQAPVSSIDSTHCVDRFCETGAPTPVSRTLRSVSTMAETSSPQSQKHDDADGSSNLGSDDFRWTPLKIFQATAIFVLAGIAEIGGGWLVWKAVRENKPWWWAVIGSLVMVLYAFLPTLQPTDSFGRIYAVYGGFFIALSYVWGWLFDGMKPDTGDVVGGSLALVAVLIIQYWPRKQ